jgi:anti-sigma regulatory factor (Ser/Thr protein kinase)
MTSKRRFPCQPRSVTAARHFARAVLKDQPRETLEAVELMVSELATNAVRHAHSGFDLTIRTTTGQLRVEIRDNGQGQPELRSPTPLESSGRGLRIVEAMSQKWGVVAESDSKLVWFTLPAQEPSKDALERAPEATPARSQTSPPSSPGVGRQRRAPARTDTGRRSPRAAVSRSRSRCAAPARPR